MSMKYYDNVTGKWIELERNQDGKLVPVATQEAAPVKQTQPQNPAGTVVSAKIEQDPNFEGVPADRTYTRFGRELEQAAKMAMQQEQEKKGFQHSLDTGLALATQDPDGESRVRAGAKRSTKQALYEAGKILEEKAEYLSDKDPKQAKMYSDYASVLMDFGDEIRTKMQDVHFGTNLHYGTPIGSGREGVPESSERPGANTFIRPELEGKTYQQAMDDTLYTQYGKQTLGNRIDEMKRYQRDNPYVSYAAGLIPIAAQWKDMKSEGLNLEDLSAIGAMQLASSAGLQGLSYFGSATPAGIAIGTLAGTGADILGAPERPDSDETFKDVLKETGASVAGSVVGAAAGKGISKLGSKVAQKLKHTDAAQTGDLTLATKIEQNKKLVDDLNSKLSEQRKIATGDPEAMQNAFVKAAGGGVEPDNAWKYSKGYLTGDDGIRITGETPWVDYARKSLESEMDASAKLLNMLDRAKKNKSDANADMDKLKMTKPSDRKYNSSLKAFFEMKHNYKNKMEEESKTLAREIHSIETALKGNGTKVPDELAADIKYREEALAILEDRFKRMDKMNAPVAYIDMQKQISLTKARLERVKSVAEAKIKKNMEQMENDLLKAKQDFMRVYKESQGGEPVTQGFVSAKERLRNEKHSFDTKSKEYNLQVKQGQEKLVAAEKKISEIERKIEDCKNNIKMLQSPETEKNFRSGAEAILRREAENKIPQLERDLDSKMMRGDLLALQMGNSKTAPAKMAQDGDGFISHLVRGTSLNGGGDAALGRSFTPHKDLNAENDMNIGSPFLRYALEFFPNNPAGTKERVNKYRGFSR